MEKISALSLKNENKLLLWIVCIGALIRIYVCFGSTLPHMHRDSWDYFKQADALLAGGYINYFPNGYPAIIAYVKVFAGANTEMAMLWLHIIMAVATMYFVYKISKLVFKNISLALFTILILAIYPTQINLVRWLTSEIPTTFLLTAAYLSFYKNKYWISGILLGAATLVRTEVIFIAALLIVCQLLFSKKINYRLAIAFLIPVILMGMYCKFKTGKFAIAGHSRVNIMYSITAAGADIDWKYIDKHPEITTDKQATDAYISHLKNEPVQFIKERAANLWELWGIPSSADGTRSNASRWMIAAGNFVLVFFGIAAWWINRKNLFAFVLILPFVIITGLHTMMYSLQRYTFPAEPFMIILAMAILYQWIFVRTPKRLAD